MVKNSGDFGKLVQQYQAVRPQYPTKIIRDIYKEISKAKPVILDLGCGTGIATRQLAKTGALVVGCDIDLDMIRVALEDNQTNTAYIQGSAEKIPFGSQLFDVVTIFTAFHWFTTKKALSEIKRVLKPKSPVFIVQPRHTAPFRSDLRNILEKELKRKLAPKYNDKTEFSVLLAKSRFTQIKKHVVKSVDKYTLEQYMSLVQSYSIWNQVPVGKQKEMLKVVRKHFKTKLENGYINDTVDNEVISAKVP